MNPTNSTTHRHDFTCPESAQHDAEVQVLRLELLGAREVIANYRATKASATGVTA